MTYPQKPLDIRKFTIAAASLDLDMDVIGEMLHNQGRSDRRGSIIFSASVTSLAVEFAQKLMNDEFSALDPHAKTFWEEMAGDTRFQAILANNIQHALKKAQRTLPGEEVSAPAVASQRG